jgi:hypothetical protein
MYGNSSSSGFWKRYRQDFCQNFDVQNDVQILGGPKLHTSFVHGDGSGSPADQNVLVLEVLEPFLKN